MSKVKDEQFKKQSILVEGGSVDIDTAPGNNQDNTAESLNASEVIAVKEKDAIGQDEIKKANDILQKYKDSKSKLESKIVANEQWWKMRHWDTVKQQGDDAGEPKPASGWLFNCIISKHADFMDSIPSPVILPREETDTAEASSLTSILPVILEQNEFDSVYSEETLYKIKNGTGCFGVFWDNSKLNGLGDISIKNVDLLTLYWEPGIKNIQDSRNVFSLQLVDNDVLENTYPQTKGKLVGNNNGMVKKYILDDSIDTSNKSLVVDWYYKKNNGSKTVLHFCKYVNDIVLYATENDTTQPTQLKNTLVGYDDLGYPIMQEIETPTGEPVSIKGLYAHGLYPFVFDVLFREEGTPYGFGFVDVCKNPQISIDIYNNAFEKSLTYNATPRYFKRQDASVNEEQFLDPTQMLIEVDGNLGDDALKPVTPTRLDGIYVSILNNKIEELKETSGNRDVNNGGATSGVTAASAIAAMQEQSGKTSRDMIATTYRSYRQVINLCVELIREFYDLPRQFRIIGDKGAQQFVSYSNQNIKPIYQGNYFGQDMGYRLPVFDIKVSAEKENKYSQMAQNELALQFYSAGFFNPQLSDQALMALSMMKFEGKDELINKISQNGGMYQQMLMMQQQMLQLSQIVDAQNGTNMADTAAGQIMQNIGGASGGSFSKGTMNDINGGENSIVAKARDQAQSSTEPR